jgi:demethylspheroidene O-methyltransferase
MAASAWAWSWRERWLDQRDRWLSNPVFRAAAARFPLTRPFARRRSAELFDLVAGFVYTQWLAASVELQLFERLARGPMTAAELARWTDLPPESAKRLLEATAALELTEVRGIDAQQQTPRYGLGVLGAALVGNEAVISMIRHHHSLFADLADPVALLRSDRHNSPLSKYWTYARESAPGALPSEQTAPYSALMSASQSLVAGQVLDAYPIGRHRHLLDLGGGEGVFAQAALEHASKLRATVFDLPAVAAAARARFERCGLSGRAQAVGGDFHRDNLPEGADVVSLVRVIYDHDDEPAKAILRSARKALKPGGTLLLAEPMAGTAGAQRMGAAYFGMYLMAMGSGRSRSPAELAALVGAAGFHKIRERKTALPLQAGLLTAEAC